MLWSVDWYQFIVGFTLNADFKYKKKCVENYDSPVSEANIKQSW